MTTFKVPDMSCGHCKATIEKAIGDADASAAVSFDMDARAIDVSSRLSNEDVMALLNKEGYASTVAT